MSQNTAGTQTIAATVIVSGPQTVHIDTHGTGGRGSYLSVSTQHLMITVHDKPAARTYAHAWTDAAGSAVYLPAHRGLQVETLAARAPGIVIAAYGKDRVRAVYAPDRRELRIRVGYLTWVLADREAFDSLAQAWHAAMDMAQLMLPGQ